MLAECEVLSIRAFKPNIFEAVLTYPELRLLAILLRVGGEVPGVYLKFAYLDLVYVLNFGESFMFFLQGSSGGVHLSIGLQCHHQSHKHTHTHTHKRR